MKNKIRLLLVDDERLVLSSLRRLFARQGFLVHTCASGAEALAFLSEDAVDVIVSDFKMPGMNGIEFLENVSKRWPDIKRCMLTAQADKDLLASARESGLLHRTFTKPWDNRTLVAELESLVGQAAGRRDV